MAVAALQKIQLEINQVQKKQNKSQFFQQQLSQLKRQYTQTQHQKKQFQQSLFYLRLTFISQQKLTQLTKKLQFSKSNPFLKTLGNQESEKAYFFQDKKEKPQREDRKNIFLQKQQKNEELQRNQKKLEIKNHKFIECNFLIVFILVIIGTVSSAFLSILYYHQFLNIVVFAIILTIFLCKCYSKIMIKCMLFGLCFNFIAQFADTILNFDIIFNKGILSGTGSCIYKSNINLFETFFIIYLVLTFIITISKIFLVICLSLILSSKQVQKVKLSLCCVNFEIQLLYEQDTGQIHQALIKSFVLKN